MPTLQVGESLWEARSYLHLSETKVRGPLGRFARSFNSPTRHLDLADPRVPAATILRRRISFVPARDSDARSLDERCAVLRIPLVEGGRLEVEVGLTPPE